MSIETKSFRVPGTDEQRVNVWVRCNGTGCKEYMLLEAKDPSEYLADLHGYIDEAGWLGRESWHLCHSCRQQAKRSRILKPDSAAKWAAVYFRCLNSGKTFRQADGLFFTENRYWCSVCVPYMPTSEIHWPMLVSDVPFNELVQPEIKEPPPRAEVLKQGVLF